MSDEPDAVRYERTGAAAVVTIDRPHRRNAVDGETAARLHEAYERFEADEDARVMVLTGAGGISFCAGADLKATETMAGRLMSAEGPMGFTRLTPPSPRSPRSRGSVSPAGWSWRCGATCASPPRARPSATPSGAGACR